MEFPFPVPEDLTALSAEEFATFAAQVRAHAATVVADENATAESLTATRDLFTNVQAEETRRAEATAAATAAREEMAAGLSLPRPTDPPPPRPTDPPPPRPTSEAGTSVTASTGRSSTIDTPPDSPADRYAIMTASSDAPGSGGELESFADAGRLIENRLSTYSSSTKFNPRARALATSGPGSRIFQIGSRTLTRHGNVAFRRQFPDALRITDGKNALSVLEHAADERRLPGGSLRESAKKLVAAGRSLTAAVGWCAPSETIYDLAELEAVDGILDLPEVQATRGGFFIPEDGGPDFASIFEGMGNAGDVILSEYDVENDTAKVCVEIPCPDFVEVRLDVAYVCITGSLLQRRGYPEAVARFSRGTMVALAHKINESVISRIVTASGGPTVIPTIVGSDDAASQLLSAVELAIEDVKYRNRMSRGSTLEIVLPAWVIAPIRAALARRRGVMAINVTDAEILEAFTVRSAVPRFVYDWQDAFSGLVGGPGGAAPITEFPDTVQFLAYPAGTWTKAVRDVVNLDTVYDNALLTQNQYTALFAEDGFNTLQMSPESRLYQVDIDPAGIVGCCDPAS